MLKNKPAKAPITRQNPGRDPTLLEIFLTRLAFPFYGRSVYRDFADRLKLSENSLALDFGSGMGTVAYYAAKKLPRGSLTCADISPRWLRACRKTLRGFENVTFLQTAPGRPALPESFFDVAWCHFVLHDIPENELEEVLPALARSLKPGGTFAFREPLSSKKLGFIKTLTEKSGLTLKDSRITDIPLMGNALESVYTKNQGGLYND